MKSIDFYITILILLPLTIINILIATDRIKLKEKNYVFNKKVSLVLNIFILLYILLFSQWRFESENLFSTYYPVWLENKGVSSYFIS